MSEDRIRALIVGDRRRAGVAGGVERHLPFLESRLDVVAVDLDGSVDLATVDADLVLVFGGDGSILHVARRLGETSTPMLGVNYGRFGFLADVDPDDLEDAVERLLQGAYVTSERARLRVRLKRGNEVEQEWLAFNDVVLGRESIGRMVDVDVRVEGNIAIAFSGDGLILATATGSTAHAMAAGGPLLDPTVNAIVMVPIAPHSLAMRPVVLSGEHTIELTVSPTRAAASVSVDGLPAVTIDHEQSVEVVDAKAPVRLLRALGSPFYDTLRSKLGWRGRLDYRTERPS
ncbi:MAG: NAD(+)/NADH kinase [Planctomycetota bacterium]|nr:NAD(+)/NADH kinase [Planctomycetota bacterium]